MAHSTELQANARLSDFASKPWNERMWARWHWQRFLILHSTRSIRHLSDAVYDGEATSAPSRQSTRTAAEQNRSA